MFFGDTIDCLLFCLVYSGLEDFAEGAWEEDVIHQHGGFEKWGDFLVREAGYAAADSGYQEGKFRVLHREGYKLVT